MDIIGTMLPALIAGATTLGTEFVKGAGKDAWEGVRKLFGGADDKAALAKLEADPSDAGAAAALAKVLAGRSADDLKGLQTALAAFQPLLADPKLAEAVNINLKNIKAKGGVTFENIISDIGSIRIETGDIESEGTVSFSGIGGPLSAKKP
jgi:hypothetical protein